MSYKLTGKGPCIVVCFDDIRWSGRFPDFVERPPKPKKGLPFTKAKRKKKGAR